jgi:glycyl-tRNA synthetase
MAEPKENPLMERIVSLCKRRGFIFQSSEIYGAINGFWDYGPLGAELKRNVKELWWRSMTQEREDVVGLEASIIMHPKIWEASGHTSTFSDPMVDCLLTKKRFRADQIELQSGIEYTYTGAVDKSAFDECSELIAAHPDHFKRKPDQVIEALVHRDYADIPEELRRSVVLARQGRTEGLDLDSLEMRVVEKINSARKVIEPFAVLVQPGKPPESARRMATQFYYQRGLASVQLLGERADKVENSRRFNPENGSLLTEPRQFNLMFKTYVGPVESEENVAYLRPETAQAIFAQFKTVLEVSRQKVPFGICQIGKAFRNEINPRNFTFRSREFEQMELEFFIRPDEAVEAICGKVASAAEVSNIEHPTSNIEHPTSDIQHPTSNIQHRTSNIEHPTSDIQHPTEAVLDPGPSTRDPSSWGWEAWHKYWVEQRIRWYESIGLPRATLVEYWQKPDELAHYARATVDILFKFPFSKRDEQGELTGEELEGIAARSDFDLSQHQRFAGKPMGVFDEELKAAWAKLDPAKRNELWQRYHDARHRYFTNAGVPAEQAAQEAKDDADGLAKGNYTPHVIEPSAGVDRLILALICHAYAEDQAPDEKGKLESRVVMRFHPRIAPIKVAVFPLLKNRPELVRKAKEVRDLLRPHMAVFYDEVGAIGRRYRRQDEAGTPFGVTIDFDTLGEKGPELQDTVTLRDRDSMKQERVRISELLPLLLEKIR